MDIDLSQFSKVFFEESLEGLDIMESELLAIDIDTPEAESINTIFRAAHSIKGGSATFGFSQVANYTHLLETLLDEIRDQQRTFNQQHQDMLLRSVDLLRKMLDALMLETGFDETDLDALTAELTQELAITPDSIQTTETINSTKLDKKIPTDATPTAASSTPVWQIDFKAGEDILRYGNHPNLMFAELQQLGQLELTLLGAHAPAFEEIDPESCYLHWSLQLQTDVELPRIKEVFEWVEDECEISFQQLEQKNEQMGVEAVETTSSINENQTVDLQTTSQDIPTPLAQPQTSTTTDSKNQTPKKPVVKAADQGSIRVSIEKIDMLINMVGELVITQAMLGQIGEQEEIDDTAKVQLQQGLEQLASHTRDLQESVMQIRMLPISFAFNRFPRLVRDISQQLGKNVELIMKGEDTELDKTVMEKIVDPMVHLVRNSLDHGLETPQQRLAKGKPEQGAITLNAYHQGGNIIIEIIDDGAGLNTHKILAKAKQKGLIAEDEQLSDDAIHQLIFHPGFSTAETVSDLSGRGVGMDVVKRNIQELNGTIELASEVDKGSRVTIRLPLTLAILDGQLVRVGQHIYVVPLVSIYESLQIEPDKINRLSDGNEVFHLRDEYLPIIKVYQQFNHQTSVQDTTDGLVMVVDANNEKVGIFVDELLAQQQVVIKNLEDNYTKIPGISGATILGDGTVALIIDVIGLVKMAGVNNSKERAA